VAGGSHQARGQVLGRGCAGLQRHVEGTQSNRQGRASMNANGYCGNLLWQRGLTLVPPYGVMLFVLAKV